MDGILERWAKMDPNATLAKIRELMVTGEQRDFFDLAWAIEDLDKWLSSGGFPPEAWRHNR